MIMIPENRPMDYISEDTSREEEWEKDWAEKFSNMSPSDQAEYIKQEDICRRESEEKGTWYEIYRRSKDQDRITEVKGPFFEVSKLVSEFERISRTEGRERKPVPGFVVLFRHAKIGGTVRAVVFSDDTLSVAESILDSIQETDTKKDGHKKNVFKRTSEAIAGQETVFSNLEEETRVDNVFWRSIAGFGSLMGVAEDKEGMGIGIVALEEGPDGSRETERNRIQAILKSGAESSESISGPFKLMVTRNLKGQVWLEKVKAMQVNEAVASRRR